MKKTTQQLVLSGLFLSLGVIFPVAFHAFGSLGTILLPMHIPVLIAAYVLSPVYAIAVGVLTPILSSILTGMPPMFPTLPGMIVELCIYATTVSVLRTTLFEKDKVVNIYIVLLIAMVLGRIALGIANYFIFISSPDMSIITAYANVLTSTINGLAGIVLQLLFVPPVVMLIRKIQK